VPIFKEFKDYEKCYNLPGTMIPGRKTGELELGVNFGVIKISANRRHHNAEDGGRTMGEGRRTTDEG